MQKLLTLKVKHKDNETLEELNIPGLEKLTGEGYRIWNVSATPHLEPDCYTLVVVLWKGKKFDPEKAEF